MSPERAPCPTTPERANDGRISPEREPRDIDALARRHVALMRQAAADVRKPEGS